ncbi:hypothetical protein [Actinomadura monticuli]|uniref:DUF4352 domain-containing protein n=1 Tax=Actinomadura monticuli TaxID=3097367 RepID=A0ABV4QKW6_9ACTN
MKRRTDRAIAISAVAAVAVVPTAILMVVKVGGDSGKDAGAMPPAAAMAQQDGTNPNGSTAGTVTPGASPAPGARNPGAPGAGPGAGNGGGAHGLPTAPPQPGPSLHSFTRKTDMKVTIGANGDYQHAVETASFTLWPKFAMSATGVTATRQNGELSKVTQKVIVSGNVLKGFDGEKWTTSTLTAAQLGKLQSDSDPRQFTFMIGTLPGMTASEPDASGRTQFSAQALMGGVYALLPQDAATRFRTWVPDSTGCGLDLWADSSARPTTIRLNAQSPGAGFDGSMSFGSYR